MNEFKAIRLIELMESTCFGCRVCVKIFRIKKCWLLIESNGVLFIS